jgi:hypothetical protein
MKSKIISGYSYMDNDVVFLLNEDTLTTYGYEFLNNMSNDRLIFKKNNAEFSLKVSQIISIKLEKTDDALKNAIQLKPTECLKVTYQDNEKICSVHVLEIVDMVL